MPISVTDGQNSVARNNDTSRSPSISCSVRAPRHILPHQLGVSCYERSSIPCAKRVYRAFAGFRSRLGCGLAVRSIRCGGLVYSVGRFARHTRWCRSTTLKASSEFGVQFDSFADFIVFGTAPAALVYYRLSALPEYSSGSNQVFLIAVTAGYVVATACRPHASTSRNVGGDRFFFSLQPPDRCLDRCELFVVSPYEHEALFLQYALMIQMVLGISMVSNLRLPKLKMRNNVLSTRFRRSMCRSSM